MSMQFVQLDFPAPRLQFILDDNVGNDPDGSMIQMQEAATPPPLRCCRSVSD